MKIAETEQKKYAEQIAAIKNSLKVYMPDTDGEMLLRAFDIAVSAYSGLTTVDGRPLIEHYLEVASVLTEYNLDEDSLCSTLLREASLHGDLKSEISKKLSREINRIVELLGRLMSLRLSVDESEQAEYLRQMLISTAGDVRILMIEIASRLVSMRHQNNIAEDKLESYAQETLDIFSPLSHRLGVSKLTSEMEDLCFSTLYPSEYNRLKRIAGETSKQREEAVSKIIEQIKDLFKKHGLSARITGRTKHLFSTYKKMIKRGKDFNELYDLSAVRIITNTEMECYQALSILHTTWGPVSEEYDDYIAVPKPNGYRSIHTVVIAPNGQPVEVQIRTWEMHQTSEFGVAAHWRYKETPGAKGKSGQSSSLFSDLHTEMKLPSSKEGLKSAILDTMDEKVFVLTPRGKVIRLQVGATPIDFAYRIHTEVGHQCHGAKVNGKIATLDRKLKNGDVVEIITQKGGTPSRDWLRIAVTQSARTKVHAWFRNVDREENIIHGRAMLQRELDHRGLKRKDLLEKIGYDDILRTFNYKAEEDLYAALGCGDITLEGVVGRIRREYHSFLSEESALEPAITTASTRRRRIKQKQDIVVDGFSDVMVSFAKCCFPIPNDSIIGYVTLNRGLAIHRKECRNVKKSVESGSRLVKVSWGDTFNNLYVSVIEVNSLDTVNIMKDVLAGMNEAGASVLEIRKKILHNSTALLTCRIEIPSADRIDSILNRLRRIIDVLSANRKIV